MCSSLRCVGVDRDPGNQPRIGSSREPIGFPFGTADISSQSCRCSPVWLAVRSASSSPCYDHIGRRALSGCVTATVLVIGLIHQQGTLQRLPDYPVALVMRGEDWRAGDAGCDPTPRHRICVYLDAGLIEANAWLSPSPRLADNRRPNNLTTSCLRPTDPTAIDRIVVPTTLNFAAHQSIDCVRVERAWRAREVPRIRVIVITRRPASRDNRFRQFNGAKSRFRERLGDLATECFQNARSEQTFRLSRCVSLLIL